eukprot:1161602-Pelagomonas_calceolata.AAC.4
MAFPTYPTLQFCLKLFFSLHAKFQVGGRAGRPGQPSVNFAGSRKPLGITPHVWGFAKNGLLTALQWQRSTGIDFAVVPLSCPCGAGFMSVLATLRVKFAKTVTLGVSLADCFNETAQKSEWLSGHCIAASLNQKGLSSRHADRGCKAACHIPLSRQAVRISEWGGSEACFHNEGGEKNCFHDWKESKAFVHNRGESNVCVHDKGRQGTGGASLLCRCIREAASAAVPVE